MGGEVGEEVAGSGLATMRGDDVLFSIFSNLFCFLSLSSFRLVLDFLVCSDKAPKETFLHSSLDSRVPFYGWIFHEVIVFFAALRIYTLERR